MFCSSLCPLCFPSQVMYPMLHLFALDELIAGFESLAGGEAKPPLCRALSQTSVRSQQAAGGKGECERLQGRF